MSRVFVAEEKRLGRRVVIKVLSSELAATLSTERFEREVQLAASLQQANIVPVLTAGIVEGTPFYTMPFVEGESVRGRLSRGALSEHEALNVLRDVACALVYAHERDVVHRDIKPDNVLLSGEAAVATDFGLAKAINVARTHADANASRAITQLGTAIVTPAYMAPEQAAGDSAMDHRADLYAFGCDVVEDCAPVGHAQIPPQGGDALARADPLGGMSVARGNGYAYDTKLIRLVGAATFTNLSIAGTVCANTTSLFPRGTSRTEQSC